MASRILWVRTMAAIIPSSSTVGGAGNYLRTMLCLTHHLVNDLVHDLVLDSLVKVLWDRVWYAFGGLEPPGTRQVAFLHCPLKWIFHSRGVPLKWLLHRIHTRGVSLKWSFHTRRVPLKWLLHRIHTRGVSLNHFTQGEWHFPNSNYDEAAHNAVDVGRWRLL